MHLYPTNVMALWSQVPTIVSIIFPPQYSHILSDLDLIILSLGQRSLPAIHGFRDTRPNPHCRSMRNELQCGDKLVRLSSWSELDIMLILEKTVLQEDLTRAKIVSSSTGASQVFFTCPNEI